MEWQNSNNFDASESETAEAENNSEVPENETVEAEPEQPTYIFTGNGKYKINEKFELAKTIAKKKKEYDEKIKKLKPEYNKRTNTWKVSKPKEGYLSNAIRSFYSNLKDKPSDDKLFRSALKVGQRFFTDHFDNSESPLEEPKSKKAKYRAEGVDEKQKHQKYVMNFLNGS